VQKGKSLENADQCETSDYGKQRKDMQIKTAGEA
jgi:hypothetical protein